MWIKLQIAERVKTYRNIPWMHLCMGVCSYSEYQLYYLHFPHLQCIFKEILPHTNLKFPLTRNYFLGAKKKTLLIWNTSIFITSRNTDYFFFTVEIPKRNEPTWSLYLSQYFNFLIIKRKEFSKCSQDN